MTNNVFLFVDRSITIQRGTISIINAIRIPRGFMYKESKKLPLNKERTDLVEPHDAQGKFVACLNKQTSTVLVSD